MEFLTSNTARHNQRAPLALKVTALITAFLFACPAIYLVWRNITSDSDPLKVLFSEQTLSPLIRTINLTIVVTLSAAILGTGLAWLTIRTDLPSRRILKIILPLPLVFPTFVGAAAFIRTLNPGGLANNLVEKIGIEKTLELHGLFGAWLVLTLFTYPYVFLPVAARLKNLASSLEESARLLGDSSWSTFRKIILPQIASSLLAGSLLVFLYTISDFGAVQLMRYDTLTRAIWTTRLNNQPVSFALAVILLTFAALAVIIETLISRRFRKPDTSTQAETVLISLGKWKPIAITASWLVVFLALITPTIALGDWAADGLLREFRGGRPLFIDFEDIIEPTINTAWISMLTALIAAAIVLPVSYLVARYKSSIGNTANAIMTSTFAMPGLLIALSMFFWTLKNSWAAEHLRGTIFILIFAYLVRFSAQALGPARASVASIPPSLEDASQVLGASKIKRFFTIDIPVVAPGLLAGSGLVLLSTMKELPITLLVAPFEFPTLTTKIFQSFEDAFVAEGGLLALILVLLSAVLTWVLVIRRADHLA
ncbi:MAG TPA: iron ABC transporter permease [Acidimicrobiales bacterium]|nr:iron ABC transporter permease [Acidimicrobiales bacterium]HJM37760.1 iron ABC transporter permease [Acidimicrobiales bacterium]